MTNPLLFSHSLDGGVISQQPILWPQPFKSPTHHRRTSHERVTINRQTPTQPVPSAASFKENTASFTSVRSATPPSARKSQQMSFSQRSWQGPGPGALVTDNGLASNGHTEVNGLGQSVLVPAPQIYTVSSNSLFPV